MKGIYSNIRLSVIAFLITLLSFLQPVFGQTGVKIAATAGPADASAILDLTSSNKGLLFPRVALVGLTNATSPILNPATGLVVYNLGTGGVASTGIYFWNGTSWVQLTSGGLSGSGTANQVTKFTGANSIGNSIISDDGTNVKVASLTGTGYRPVAADATGTLKTVTLFNCTGADQTWVCPAGVTSIIVKLWGAGGGSGAKGGWTTGYSGGGGGYTTATVAVTAGQTYFIVVGQGGGSGLLANLVNTYGGGGRSCGGGTDCQYGGAGGGRSAFRNTANNADLVTAGGGGGGGSIVTIASTNTCRGGAGGGSTAQVGECIQTAAWAGGGGTQVGGGAAGTGGSCVGAVGTQYQGGAMTCGQSYGGGGGGGWFGGGSGSYSASSMGGGGGGSGYIGGAGVSAGTTTVGSFQQPAGASDPNYLPGVGFGGMGNGGGNGLVVIITN